MKRKNKTQRNQKKSSKRKGSIKEVLGLTKKSLGLLIRERLEEYIRVDYLSGSSLTHECRMAIPFMGYYLLEDVYENLKSQRIITIQDYIVKVKEAALKSECARYTKLMISSVNASCKRGISEQRKSELEKSLEILSAPTMCSGPKW